MTDFSGIYAAQLNITIKKADTASIIATLTDPNNSDAPVDLSAYDELLMQIKSQKAASTSLLELTLGSGLSITGVSNNELTIDITATQATLDAATLFYDVQGTNTGTGLVRTLLTGTFIVSDDVSR